MTHTLDFSRKVCESLRDGELTSVEDRHYRVCGRLDLVTFYAEVTIEVPWLFKDLKRVPPRVVCHETWMKVDSDWHINEDGTLCWVLAREWSDVMAWKGKPAKAIITEGHTWLMNGVRCLISRHKVAHDEKLTKWPEEWPQWDHQQKGVEQYERERRRAEWGQ